MPFVNIRLYEGHGNERKEEIEEVPPADWYAAGKPGQPVEK
jgi:phenylpyruvate tautomerase PptA (4-oxalocrotonate tautomerase family)